MPIAAVEGHGDDGFGRSLRLTAALTLALALAVAISAALSLQGLYADGAEVLLEIMQAGSFAADWQPSRWTVHVLQQLPAVLAMRWGVDDPQPLGVLMGLGMYVTPLGLLAACYVVLPREAKGFFLFPLFHHLAGSEAATFVGIAEGPVAATYFWLLLFLILFRANGPVSRGAAVLAAIPACWLHEALVFLAPVLAVAALIRVRRDDGSSKAARAVFGALALWFLVVTIYQLSAVAGAPDPQNRSDFVRTMLRFGILLEDNAQQPALRINVPALLGVHAGGAILSIWRGEKGWLGPARTTRVALAAFGLVAVALVAGSLWHGALLSPRAQFQARSWGAIMSLPLAIIFLVSLARPAWRGAWERRSTIAVLGILAAAQFGWQIIATHYWSAYVRDFRAVLARHEGLVSWTEALESLPADERWAFERMSWDWTSPAMSVVLAPHGRVASIIENRVAVRYQPFDPTDPAHLPAGPRFDSTVYRAALLRQQKATSQQ